MLAIKQSFESYQPKPMEKNELPTKLVMMARARRLIPFIGAGFSAPLNLPDWDTLLRKLAEDIDSPISYDAVKAYCNNDMLQIAEYYLLISDGRVGPMRHAISAALQTNCNPLMSGPHVELVNLGAPQIYTTNFDESIEKTFRALKQPVEVISLPKHLALSSDAKTQVVKYHGDLRFDHTLVLTESNYYARLDLESPMDIKFRSDLLGRSVLFIGYSFRDINIRIVWFKLKRMMKDIPDEDSPTSFIVTFSPNPVLEELYSAVGIQTICLDPKSTASTSPAKSKLLSDFMLRLVSATTDGHIPGHSGERLYFSMALGDAINDAMAEEAKVAPIYRGRMLRSQIGNLLTEVSRRTISPCHREAIRAILSSENVGMHPPLMNVVIKFLEQCGPDLEVTRLCLRGLERESTRAILLGTDLDWGKILSFKLLPPAIDSFFSRFDNEIRTHSDSGDESPPPDHDLAFYFDIAKRIQSGELASDLSLPQATTLQRLLERVCMIYPVARDFEPVAGARPDVDVITSAIDRRTKGEETPEEDVPF